MDELPLWLRYKTFHYQKKNFKIYCAFYLPAPVCVAKDIVQNSDSSARMYTMLSDAATITFA